MSELQTEVLIIGGGPGGLLAGVTGARCWPDKRIALLGPEDRALGSLDQPPIFTNESGFVDNNESSTAATTSGLVGLRRSLARE
jgi:thioredoxin reductase